MDDNTMAVPAALEPIADNYRRIAMILDVLATESELAARADLAEELVRTCATSEDAKEQALYPILVALGKTAMTERMRQSARHLGEAMVPIFQAVRHSVPLDVHTPDPSGFERNLERFVALLKTHLDLERDELFPKLSGLADQEVQRVAHALDAAHRHALEHPLPPHNPVARWLTRIEEHVDHLADTSEQYRPGRRRLAG